MNPFAKESNTKEKNYQLNMEILSSLKSLPGKVVSLQPEKFIFKNEDINKKVIFPEEKFTTSSSISKELFCDLFLNDTEKNNKKSYTSNSVFKPIAYYPIKKSTMNYYGFNSMMSFSDFLVPNPTPFNPLKITNSSYSKNSFHPMMNPDIPLINPINSINPINNTINLINPINTITSFFPNYTPFINEQILKKNNNAQTKNNFLLNKKRNADNEINLYENIKEKEYNETKENNNLTSNNIPKVKNTFFCIKQNKEQNMDNSIKKNLFTVFKKSSYVYKKRKPRKKKVLNGIKNKISCNHNGCEGKFKTKKQLVYHHYKMSVECHNDTISLLKIIYFTKNILLKKNNEKENNNIDKLSELYKETMKNISLEEHIETLVGFNFEDEVNGNKK